jgi:hypothetical protein
LKIKEWVDAPRMTIRAMRRDGYSLPNYAHFVQSGNTSGNCPFELGDTRVVVIEVSPIAPDAWLDWKTDFVPHLEEEAPALLGGLWTVPLPAKGFKRLYLPVLVTAAKQTMIDVKRRESQERDGRKTLLQAVVALAQRGKFKGPVEKLILALGQSHGEWSTIAHPFGRQLRRIEKDLLKLKVKVSFKRSKTRRIVILEKTT